MPTKKAKEIDSLLTDLTGLSRQEAEKKGVCVWCKQLVEEFRDAASEKEYAISGLCQLCQDATFGTDVAE
jgi:hypothetical protein